MGNTDRFAVFFCDPNQFSDLPANRIRFLVMVDENPPDMILLDWMLPHVSGIEVCRQLKMRVETRAIPIIMLTARGDVIDRVSGLELGADDYIGKPFEPRELVARVQAILRRLDAPEVRASLEVGDIHIDDRSKTVTVGDAILSLSPKEYKLLRLLASEPGRVFSSEEIIAHLWPDSDRAAANDVKQYIHLLRNKLYRSADVGNPIENIKGFGYRLNG